MDSDLSDDHALIQRTVREFAQSRVALAGGELDATKSFPYEIVRELGELGLTGIPFPVAHGGAGADTHWPMLWWSRSWHAWTRWLRSLR
jgi:short-chain 2-methylacyl-CoA dehydrogenase